MRFWRAILRNQRIRVALYVLVVLALFLARGPRWWSDMVPQPAGLPGESSLLTVAGADLAPRLLGALVQSYGRDYPRATIEPHGGGSAHALQALFDGEAHVALLARPPLASEQAHFERSDGTRLLYEPVALAGLALLAAETAAFDSVDTSRLKWLLGAGLRAGEVPDPAASTPGVERLIAEDPNLGLWEALLTSLQLPLDHATGGSRVSFVASRTELIQALRGDPRALGVISSLFLVGDDAPEGLKTLGVPVGEGTAVRPTHADVGQGRYPLRHALYVACRGNARGEAAKFVTFASGVRGQRIVERAGYLPARQFLREILLDSRPVGAR